MTEEKKADAYREPAERDADTFLFFAIALLMVIVGVLIWVIETYQWTGLWKAAESAFINFFTSAIGLLIALYLLRNYNKRGQQKIIDEIVRDRLADLTLALDRSRRQLSQEIRETRDAVISTDEWRGHMFLLKNTPYKKLFIGATEVGLLVQSWERWVEEHRRELTSLAASGGHFTLVIHNPDNENVIAASSARWRLRRMDQRTQIRNTIELVRSVFGETKATIVECDQLIWYCALRFRYENPADTIYVVSPYAHTDFAVAEVPAVLIRKSTFPEIADFFDNDWARLTSTSTG